MPKLDKLKEELGWLKVVFGVFIATDLSIIAWLVQKYETQSELLSIISGMAIIVITFAIVLVNKSAYKKIDEIGEL
ncbi:MAG: hypothetical protein U9N39_07715 [Campylobacterota bacterium]|nr:hypothetical protein [Campylobacterota bacterium]